ncbi:hypothetical protein [Amycolatopsis sp. cmx-11-12]|uniref:hypothetical protein n=1 Tax=Amycolatopsis sp. cmx-11-12 TaxID=2785795 RepID=UPI0039181AC1
MRGVRIARRRWTRVEHPLPEFLEPLTSHRLTYVGEPLLFFFLLDVVPHVLDEYGDFRVEPLILGIHPFQLAQHPHHHVVLFSAFEHVILGIRRRLAGGRDLLLEVGVHREFLDETIFRLVI